MANEKDIFCKIQTFLKRNIDFKDQSIYNSGNNNETQLETAKSYLESFSDPPAAGIAIQTPLPNRSMRQNWINWVL